MFRSTQSRAIGALLIAAFLYGATFVVIKSAIDDVGPISFVAWRFLLGAGLLALFAIPKGRQIWLHGSITGLALFCGYALQTSGLALTSASNSVLITGLYVVMTPFLAAAFARRAPSWWIAAAAAVSVAGLILLTGTFGSTFDPGDLLTLGCALAFALHIVALSRYARYHPVIPFTTVQLAVTAALAFLFSLLTDGPTGIPPSSTWAALALTGIGVSAGAFILQIWAQTIIRASTTALILASESVFGVATAWMVLDERLAASGWLGGALILGAIFVVVTKQRDSGSTEAAAVTPAH